MLIYIINKCIAVFILEVDQFLSYKYFYLVMISIQKLQADLIHMGAKYAGCMRKDETIQRYIERDRMNERKSGCCIRLDGSGCYQTSEDNCSYPFGKGTRKVIGCSCFYSQVITIET